MRQALVKFIFPFFLVITLIGCSSMSTTASDLYSTLGNTLTKEDQILLDSLLTHVQKFDQLNKELNMLLDEMKTDDELEAAIDAMDIANDEALYIFNLIELDSKPQDKNLGKLQEHVQHLIELYMSGMTTQLEGITSGVPTKTDKGYEQIQKVNQEFSELLSLSKK